MFKNICEAFRKYHSEHIAVYGSNNDEINSLHETQNIETFSYGYSDRGASIKFLYVLVKLEKDVEDRRPASNTDPYKVVGKNVRYFKNSFLDLSSGLFRIIIKFTSLY